MNYNITSKRLIIFLCVDNLFNDLTSGREFIVSIFVYFFFIHFTATNSPVFKAWALNTLLKVPSPSFFIILYSIQIKGEKEI